MYLTPPANPIVYAPTMERPEPDEAETTQGMVDSLRHIATVVADDEGHAMRGVHAKSHGLLVGEMRVLGGLPAVLAYGLFAAAATYPVVMRLSTPPGDVLDDSVSLPRGLAVKVIGVPGERLPTSAGNSTQDFVMVNGPAFSAPNAKAFLKNLKMLSGTTDKAPGLKKVLSAVLRGTEKVIEAVGGESATIKTLGGHPETHILGETFYTQVPFLYGPFIAKLSVAPVSPNLTALTDASLNVNGKPNGLREAVIDHFATQGGEWEVRVQLCTDLDTMPIEDASVPWPEDKSAYVAVARITVKPQTAWSDARSAWIDDGMAFNPWHGVAAHRPLGSIMRVRRTAYEMSAKFRAERNGHSAMAEPTSVDGIPA